MDQNQLKDLLYRADAVRSGHFLRASGRHSNLYIQCAHLFENARSAQEVCALIAQHYAKSGVQLVLSAAIGGMLGLQVDDERLRKSRALAEQAGMRYTISAVQLRDAHPNTVLIDAVGVSGAQISVQAVSVGGGSIRVQYLNGLEVGFSGERTTLVIQHRDTPGAIAKVSRLLAAARLNIATMRVFRAEAGGRAVMALELDSVPDDSLVAALRNVPAIQSVTLLDRL